MKVLFDREDLINQLDNLPFVENAVPIFATEDTPGAVFVKLCDRIANVQYSKMTKSRMFEMYKKENENFTSQLGWTGTDDHKYFEMFKYLNNLFSE